MNKLVIGLLVAAAVAGSSANAAPVISLDQKSVTLVPGTPQTFNVDFFATNGNQPEGASASIVFNYLGMTTLDKFDFTFSTDNTSTGSSPLARLVSFGFDARDPTSVFEVSDFTSGINTNGNFNGLGKVDVCFYSGPNCNGNGGGGVFVNAAPKTGTFSLNYAAGVNTPLVINNFRARFQSTGPTGQGSASGAGIISAVPEPATWALMLVGFGAVGHSMRRRKTADKRINLAIT